MTEQLLAFNFFERELINNFFFNVAMHTFTVKRCSVRKSANPTLQILTILVELSLNIVSRLSFIIEILLKILYS